MRNIFKPRQDEYGDWLTPTYGWLPFEDEPPTWNRDDESEREIT